MAFTEKIGTLTKTSTTQVQLTGTSVIKLGGQQRSLISPTLLISVSGIGGLDTGVIAASSFYYVYAVYNGSITGIVASTSAVSPTGFTRYKKVGAFYTEGSSNVFKAYKFREINKVLFSLFVSNTGVVSAFSGDAVTGNFVISDTSIYTAVYNTDSFSIEPATSAIACSSSTSAEDENAAVINRTASGFAVRIRNLTNTNAAQGFTVKIHKRGLDAIQPDWN